MKSRNKLDMKIFQISSIQSRLTFWFLIMTLVPLLIVLTLTYYQRVEVIKTRTEDKLIAIRDLKIDRLTGWLSERMGDMKMISADSELTNLEYLIKKSNYNSNDNINLDTGRDLLNRYLDNNSAYNNLFVINPLNGKTLISTNKSMEGNDNKLEEYFKRTMQTQEVTITDIHFSLRLSEIAMYYSSPIFSDNTNNNIVGIVVASIDLDNSLYKMLRDRVGLGNTGETLIVNDDVYALNQLRYDENAPLQLKIKAEPAKAASNGGIGVMTAEDYRGKEVLAAFAYIKETGWGFVCKQDMYELNEPIREMVKNFILIFVLTSIIILVIAFIIARSITNPIVKIDMVAKEFGDGNFSVRNQHASQDEVGSLATEFNNMAEVIESKMTIQKGVAEISEKLNLSNSMQEFGSNILQQLLSITDANMGTFYILNEGTNEYENFASIGANDKLSKSFNFKNREGEIGIALSTKRIYHLKDIPENTIFSFKTSAGKAIPKEIITIPILVEDNIVALISLINIHKFSYESIDILEQSWTGINISYSNLLASERTRIFAEQLYKTNQELEAQSHELQQQAEELQRSGEELQEQNLNIEIKNKEIEQANKLKSEFLSNMSHELRTPLNSILSLTHVLSMQTKDKLSDKEYSYLEIIDRNGKNLLKLVNDILDLSKIEADKLDVFPSPVSFRTLLMQTYENFTQLAKNKGIELLIDIPDTLPPIETDESRIQQVLVNIVGNAIKFTEKGSVKINLEYENSIFYVSISDTGIGIDESELKYIFDEFRQSDGSSSRRFEGTGLGLSIVQKLVDVLAGEINISSEIGVGTTVKLLFHENWKGENQMISLTLDSTNIQSNGGNRILIVEDNQEAVIQIKTLLENHDLLVDVATGGREALQKVKESIPDGIIVDLMMPDIDGFEVIETIRSTEETAKIPIIVLTAKDLSREELNRLSGNNIQQLIQKGDIDVDGLISKVQTLLKGGATNKTSKLTRKPFVIVVEDNPDHLVSIKAILGDQFFIKEASDGEQGYRMIKEEKPDIILMDLSLPKIDGFKVLQLIRKDDATASIPVIAVTAMTMKEDKESILRQGFNAFVSKPVNHEELISEILRLV